MERLMRMQPMGRMGSVDDGKCCGFLGSKNNWLYQVRFTYRQAKVVAFSRFEHNRRRFVMPNKRPTKQWLNLSVNGVLWRGFVDSSWTLLDFLRANELDWNQAGL